MRTLICAIWKDRINGPLVMEHRDVTRPVVQVASLGEPLDLGELERLAAEQPPPIHAEYGVKSQNIVGVSVARLAGKENVGVIAAYEVLEKGSNGFLKDSGPVRLVRGSVVADDAIAENLTRFLEASKPTDHSGEVLLVSVCFE